MGEGTVNAASRWKSSGQVSMKNEKEDEVVRRSAWKSVTECADYFVEIRGSLRNIVLDIVLTEGRDAIKVSCEVAPL